MSVLSDQIQQLKSAIESLPSAPQQPSAARKDAVIAHLQVATSSLLNSLAQYDLRNALDARVRGIVTDIEAVYVKHRRDLIAQLDTFSAQVVSLQQQLVEQKKAYDQSHADTLKLGEDRLKRLKIVHRQETDKLLRLQKEEFEAKMQDAGAARWNERKQKEIEDRVRQEFVVIQENERKALVEAERQLQSQLEMKIKMLEHQTVTIVSAKDQELRRTQQEAMLLAKQCEVLKQQTVALSENQFVCGR